MSKLRLSKRDEARLKLALRLAEKPCVERFIFCTCCFNCTWVYECYRAWRRGLMKLCRNRGVTKAPQPTWCSAVANYISDLLGHKKKKWNLSSLKPVPEDRMEKWEDEG